jgi:hypothetical protein
MNNSSFPEIMGLYDPDIFFRAKIPEVINAQETDIGRIKPEIRKRLRDWRLPPEKKHESGSNESKVGKPDNDPAADAQCFLDDEVNVLNLLHALVQNHIIKTIIRIFTQAVFNVIVKNAQSFLDTFLNGFIIELDALGPNLLIPDEGIKKVTLTASQVKHPGLGLDDRINYPVIQADVFRRHARSPPDNH